MTWFKVDDHLHSHPKTWAASLTAMGLWTVAGSWSSDQLTDGFIPEHMVAALARGQIELAEELVAAGLWERAKGGFQFHEWAVDADGTVRNPTRDEALAGRRKMSSGGELGNHRRWHEAKGKNDPSCRYCQNGGSGPRSGTRSRGDSSGAASGSGRPDANPMPGSAVDNSKPDANARASDQGSYRVPDRVLDRVPDSPPNPPSPVPSQSRPDRDGTGLGAGDTGDQSVRARARVNEALRWLRSSYGLTDAEAITAWEAAKARARTDIKNPARYLQRMAERGHMADIVEAIQLADRPASPEDDFAPAPEPEPAETGEPPPLTAIEGKGGSRSDSAPRQQSLLLHAVPDAEPTAPPLYDQDTGEDHRSAADLLADIRRKWSTGT